VFTRPLESVARLTLMSDLLAVISSEDHDAELLAELEWRHPDRVTVLLEGSSLEDETPAGRARSDRLAQLLHAIEQRTGAIVVGLAGNADQLRGWRFDRIVRAGPLAA
jgi:hypothetical protein